MLHGHPVTIRLPAMAALLLAGTAAAGAAEPPASDADQLAKQLSNPVSSLVSVPFQLNYDAGFAGGGDRWTLNIQPVVPISLNDDWNVISRTILPVITQDNVADDDSQSGLGDTVQSFFFSPKKPTSEGWIWGVGPALLVPTGTDRFLTNDQWAAGPTFVVLKQTSGGWTYGALANQLWSLSGSSAHADVNSMFLQPFLSKALGQGRTVTLNLESTYDWNGSQWTIPVNVTYSKVTKVGSQMLSWGIGGRIYLDAPAGGPDWGLRGIVTLLFPK